MKEYDPTEYDPTKVYIEFNGVRMFGISTDDPMFDFISIESQPRRKEMEHTVLNCDCSLQERHECGDLDQLSLEDEWRRVAEDFTDCVCNECGAHLPPETRVHVMEDKTFAHVTCETCFHIGRDYIGADGKYVPGMMREQIFVCLGFDYLGEEGWEPDVEKLPLELQALFSEMAATRKKGE